MVKKRVKETISIIIAVLLILFSAFLIYNLVDKNVNLSPRNSINCVDSDNTNLPLVSDINADQSYFNTGSVSYTRRGSEIILNDLKSGSSSIKEAYCSSSGRGFYNTIRCANGIYNTGKQWACAPSFTEQSVKTIQLTENSGTRGTYKLPNGQVKNFETKFGDFKSIDASVCNDEKAADVNNDEQINAVDVQKVINGALGAEEQECLDINRNNNIDAVDVQTVINCALGIYSDYCTRPAYPDYVIENVEIKTRCESTRTQTRGTYASLDIRDKNGWGTGRISFGSGTIPGYLRITFPGNPSNDFYCNPPLACKRNDVVLNAGEVKNTLINLGEGTMCCGNNGFDPNQFTFKIFDGDYPTEGSQYKDPADDFIKVIFYCSGKNDGSGEITVQGDEGFRIENKPIKVLT